MILYEIITVLLISAVTYWFLKIYRIRSKLKWIPEIKRSFLVGNALELKNPREILKVFKKYAEQHDGLCTIELGTYKFILASDPTFLEFLLGKTEILNKTDEYQFLGNWLGTGLLTAKEQKWKKTRKLLTPSFHFSILESFMDIYEKNANILIELLDKETNEDSVDIFPYCAMNTLDIISETAMGVSINAQRNPKSDYVRAVAEKCRLLIVRTYSPLKTFSLLYKLTADYQEDTKSVEVLQSYTLNVINFRKEELEKKKHQKIEDISDDVGYKKKKVFMDLLLEANVDGRPLTDDEIKDEVNTFMFAGHDTTASAMSFFLYCLSTHKDVQDKVIQEQKQIFGNDKSRPVASQDLSEMKYLEMAIKESLRMYPSVPYVGRKADRDITYKNGEIIPKDTAILILIYCVNRNPKYFPNPDQYDPNRFDGNNVLPPYTYLPFSAGPRNCIGQKFAWNLMKSVISKFLRYYEVLPCGHELILAAETVLRSENGIRLKLRKRDWEVI